MDKLKMQTPDLTDKNIERMKWSGLSRPVFSLVKMN